MNTIRSIAIACLLVLFSVPALAQFTAVSATGGVKDPNNNLYAGGRLTADFVNGAGCGLPTLAGSPFQTSVTAALDSALATFAIPLADNNQVCAGSKWHFTVCDKTGTACFSPANITITGASQNIAATLNAASVSLPGTIVVSLTSGVANPASAGLIRMATTDVINIRNAANSADVTVVSDVGAAAGNLPADLIACSTNCGGWQAPAFISATTNPAATGVFRLANTESVMWRNNAQAADIALTKTGAAAGSVPADSLNASGFGGFKFPSVMVSKTANPASAGVFRLAAADTINWRNTANGADIGFLNQGAAGANNGNLADVLGYGSGSTGGYQGQAFVSFTAAQANSGVVRLATTDAVAWRNAANGGDVTLTDAGAAAAGTGNVADILLHTAGYQGGAFVDTSAAPANSGVVRIGNNVTAVAARLQAGGGDAALLSSNTSDQAVLAATKFTASVAGMASANIPVGTAPTVPQIGDIWNDSTKKAFVISPAVASNPLSVGGMLIVLPAQTAITTVSTIQVMNGTTAITVPAGAMNVVGKTLHIKGYFVWSNGVTTPTITISLKSGSTVLCAPVSSANIASNSSAPAFFEFWVSTTATGATGNVEAHGTFQENVTTAVNGGALSTFSDFLAAVSSNFDLTAAQTITVNMTVTGGPVTTATLRWAEVDLQN